MTNLKNLRVKTKMLLLIAIFSAGFMIFGAVAYSTLNTIKINGAIYQNIKRENDLLIDVAAPNAYLIEAVYNSMRLVDEEKPEKITQFIDRLRKARERYEASHEKWQAALPEGEVKDLICVKSHKAAEEFLDAVEKQLIPMVLNGQRAEAKALSMGALRQKFIEHRGFIDQAEELTRKNLASHEAQAASIVSWRTVTMCILALLINIAVVVVAWFVVASLVGPLGEVVGRLKAIATGDVNQVYEYRSDDEVGELADAFRSLVTYLKEIAGVAESISRGDLSAEITARSERDLVSKNLRQAVTSIQGLNDEVTSLIKSANEGRLSARGDAKKFEGGYAGLVESVNEMLDAVVGPINEASACLERLSERDLTVAMSGDYRGEFARIKHSFNTAVANLGESMMQVHDGAQQVASAANEISGGSQLLAEGSTDQAATLEEISSSINEMVGVSTKNDQFARSAKSLSDAAMESTERGVGNMSQLSSAMERIKQSAWATSKIVKTIEEIAFQTNLLALNAAVEAARAGDAGKGFAVVAEEVRNLAMRSADAARQTSQLIDESVSSTEAGAKHNEEVLADLTEINSRIREVGEMMGNIVSSSQQTHLSIEQINGAVEQMNEVTQRTAANAEESAGASEELSAQSREMLELVGRFRLAAATGGRGGIVTSTNEGSRPAGPASKSKTVKASPKKLAKTNGHAPSNDEFFGGDAFGDTEPILTEF